MGVKSKEMWIMQHIVRWDWSGVSCCCFCFLLWDRMEINIDIYVTFIKCLICIVLDFHHQIWSILWVRCRSLKLSARMKTPTYKPTKSSGIYPKSDPLKEWRPVKSKSEVKVWDHLVLVGEWWGWCRPGAKWFPPNVTLCQGTEQSPVLSVRNACNCVRSGWPRDLPPVLHDGKLSSGWFSLFGNMLQIFLAF